jgi:hypothetical protein
MQCDGCIIAHTDGAVKPGNTREEVAEALGVSFTRASERSCSSPEVMIGNATERFDEQGNLTDETTKGFIRQLLQNLVDWTRRIAQEPQGTQKQ